MKLFRKENGVDVVYVQLQDLAFLFHLHLLPSFINPKDYEERIIDGNGTDYIKFSDEQVVSLLKQLDFILDRDLYESMSYDIVSWNLSKISQYIISERHKGFGLGNEFEKLQYKLNTLSHILEAKSRGEQLPLPDFNS